MRKHWKLCTAVAGALLLILLYDCWIGGLRIPRSPGSIATGAHRCSGSSGEADTTVPSKLASGRFGSIPKGRRLFTNRLPSYTSSAPAETVAEGPSGYARRPATRTRRCRPGQETVGYATCPQREFLRRSAASRQASRASHQAGARTHLGSRQGRDGARRVPLNSIRPPRRSSAHCLPGGPCGCGGGGRIPRAVRGGRRAARW